MPDAIIVQNLGKCFKRYHSEKPITLMEAVLSGLRKMKPIERFWALRHISFTVAPGEMLGIIGHNGAGKSTLLQLLGGVTQPDEGQIQINGRIGALLDLGSGFHSDLTGRENTFVTAVIAGLSKREAERRFAQIIEFAELELFIDNPIRTYSTGMQMRLAFSIAIHTDPDVLLVDEFLSVGDLAFQTKCLRRITEMKEQGCAIVLISHDASQVERLCDRALWLKQGRIAAYGEPQVVAGQYVSEMQTQTRQRTPDRPPQFASSGMELCVNKNRFGSLEAEILAVRLLPSTIESGGALGVEIIYQVPESIETPIFSVSISHEDGQICFDSNTANSELILNREGRGTLTLQIDRLDLSGGQYFVDVGMYPPTWAYAYDYHWHVYPLLINSKTRDKGILQPPHCWKIDTAQAPSLRGRYR